MISRGSAIAIATVTGITTVAAPVLAVASLYALFAGFSIKIAIALAISAMVALIVSIACRTFSRIVRG